MKLSCRRCLKSLIWESCWRSSPQRQMQIPGRWTFGSFGSQPNHVSYVAWRSQLARRVLLPRSPPTLRLDASTHLSRNLEKGPACPRAKMERALMDFGKCVFSTLNILEFMQVWNMTKIGKADRFCFKNMYAFCGNCQAGLPLIKCFIQTLLHSQLFQTSPKETCFVNWLPLDLRERESQRSKHKPSILCFTFWVLSKQLD